MEELERIFKIKRKSNNILTLLRKKETFRCRPGASIIQSRKCYRTILPNRSITNIAKPQGYARRFSPCGKVLLAFSANVKGIEIWKFKGSSAFVQHAKEKFPNGKFPLEYVKENCWQIFFDLTHEVELCTAESMHRDCGIFSDDSRFAIVASQNIVPERGPVFYDRYRNNESITTNPKYPLENYTVYVVDTIDGTVCDSLKFPCDKIFFYHNQGIYLLHRTMAILSVQHQTIYLYSLLDDGQLIPLRNIGRFLLEDDELLVSSMAARERRDGSHWWQDRPFHESFLCSLKQRILGFLYRSYVMDSEERGSLERLRQFYINFHQFESLKIWRMQLLDEHHLLLKLASEDVVTQRLADPNTCPCFFVVYNHATTQVLCIYENISLEFQELFERFADFFKGNPSLTAYQTVTSAHYHVKLKQTISCARYGGPVEATRRTLSQIPLACQSWAVSPYLDATLFSYDEKYVLNMERPRQMSDHPLWFFSRETGIPLFDLRMEHIAPSRNPPPSSSPSQQRFMQLIFHPYEPFAISIQRTADNYVLNVHVRLPDCAEVTLG